MLFCGWWCGGRANGNTTMFNQADTPQDLSERSCDLHDAAANASVISSDLTISGSVDAQGSIIVEGQINGDVNCQSVLVQETGTVEGSLTADDINIYGTVDGTISGKRVSIRATSRVEADIYHELIELEMGTEFTGVLKRSDSDTSSTSKSSPASEVYQLSASDEV